AGVTASILRWTWPVGRVKWPQISPHANQSYSTTKLWFPIHHFGPDAQALEYSQLIHSFSRPIAIADFDSGGVPHACWQELRIQGPRIQNYEDQCSATKKKFPRSGSPPCSTSCCLFFFCWRTGCGCCRRCRAATKRCWRGRN